jgi:hypothetical protein
MESIINLGDKLMTTMTPDEANRLHQQGREIITQLANISTRFEEYKGIFESRGGAIGMGEEYGPNTEVMVGVYNDLADMLAANNNWNQQVLDKNRTDY